jgi:high frequency lysogenization protein
MKDQTLTFAAICQVAAYVQSVSRQGSIDEQAFSVLLNSLIEMTPANTLAVYGGDISNLKPGL